MTENALDQNVDENPEEFYRSPMMTVDADPWALALEDIDMATGRIFQAQRHHEFFKRLRQENPVHYHDKNPDVGPYWSLTRYEDIMAVDNDFQRFSSEPSIALFDELLGEERAPMFIAMDPPRHDEQRAAVQPAVSPVRLKDLDQLIRGRTVEVLDELPTGTPFNWVDKVSIELTTRMLATLFDFPFEKRRKLTYWSDIITTPPILMGLTIEDRLNHAKTKAYEGPEQTWPDAVAARADGFTFTPEPGRRLDVTISDGTFGSAPEWTYMVPHPDEKERALGDCGDLFSPGYFAVDLAVGADVTLNASIGARPASPASGPPSRRNATKASQPASAASARLPARDASRGSTPSARPSPIDRAPVSTESCGLFSKKSRCGTSPSSTRAA